MNLVTCKLCGRLFSATRGKICVTCLDEIDDLYPKVREFLRDHSKEKYNVEQIANGMDLDIRYVQALVELGYLDRGVGADPEAEEEKNGDRSPGKTASGITENSASTKLPETRGKCTDSSATETGKKK